MLEHCATPAAATRSEVIEAAPIGRKQRIRKSVERVALAVADRSASTQELEARLVAVDRLVTAAC